MTNAGCTSVRPGVRLAARGFERVGEPIRVERGARGLRRARPRASRRWSSSASFSALGHAQSSPIVSGVTDWNAVTNRCSRCASRRPALDPISSRASA